MFVLFIYILPAGGKGEPVLSFDKAFVKLVVVVVVEFIAGFGLAGR